MSEWASVWIGSSNRATCRYKANENLPNKHRELWTNISFNLTSSSHFKTLLPHSDIRHTSLYSYLYWQCTVYSVQCTDTPYVLLIYLQGLFALNRKYTCFVDNDSACFNFVIHLKFSFNRHIVIILPFLFCCSVVPNTLTLNNDPIVGE